jgi:hypothetical protein
MKQIIGLVGFAGSGKGTVGEILRDKYAFKLESFAAPVKDAAAAVMGWPRSLLEGDTKESREFREQKDDWWSERLGKEVTPRWVLQQFGTDVFRNHFHQDVWVDSLEYRLSTQPNYSYAITDVRFPNEIERIEKMGGRILVVQRGELPSWYEKALNVNLSGLVEEAIRDRWIRDDIGNEVHYSEWAWIGYTNNAYLIKNDGTLADLERNVSDFMFDLAR